MVVAARPLRGRGRRRAHPGRPTSSCPSSSASRRPAPATALVHADVPGQRQRPPAPGGRRRRGRDGRRPAPADPRPADRAQRVHADGGQGRLRPLGQRRASSLRLYSSTQTSTGVRAAVAAKLGMPLAKVECIAPDVGGGFGVKIMHPWPEEVLVPWAAPQPRPRGQVDRGPSRALHLQRARARPAAGGHGRLRRRGPPARARRAVLARQRRLHALRHHRADHHLHPAARALQAGRLPRRVLVALHQHRPRDAVPGRRPPAGLLRDGAHHGRDRGRSSASTAPRCARATSSSPTRCPTTTA